MKKEEFQEKYPRVSRELSELELAFPLELAATFERVMARIEALWRTEEAAGYLDSLLVSDRPSRQGFPPSVISEVMLLRQVLSKLNLGEKTDGWDPYAKVHREMLASLGKSGTSLTVAAKQEVKAARASAKSPYVAGKRANIKHQHNPQNAFTPPDASHHVGGGGEVELATDLASKGNDLRSRMDDAELLCTHNRFESASIILEHWIAFHPAHSPDPYRRLLWIYRQMERQNDFDRINRTLEQLFSDPRTAW